MDPLAPPYILTKVLKTEMISCWTRPEHMWVKGFQSSKNLRVLFVMSHTALSRDQHDGICFKMHKRRDRSYSRFKYF